MKITIRMKEFNDLEDAFEYFVYNLYDELTTTQKNKIKHHIYDYKSKRQGISEKKRIEILEKYASAKIEKSFKIFL